MLRYLCIFFLHFSFVFSSPLLNKPVLYYLSSPGCPACRMMKPVIEEIEKEYEGKIRVIKMVDMSKEKMDVIRKFSSHVNLQYIPSMVFAGKDDILLGFTRGYVPKDHFKKLVDEAIEKFQAIDEMKIEDLILVCSGVNDSCKKLSSTVQNWLQSEKQSGVRTEILDMSSLENEKSFQEYKKRMEKISWLHGLEFLPAVIALGSQDRAIDYIQSGVSLKELQTTFNAFLKSSPAQAIKTSP